MSHLAKRLLDASNAIERIRRYSAGKSFADFESDDYFRSAVERQFEVLAEALNVASRLDPTLDDRIPELRRIVGLRNRLAHEYDEIDDQIIWDAVVRDIDALADQVESVLSEFPPPGT